VAFIFTPGNYEDLELIRSHFPNGMLQQWHNDDNGFIFLQAYLVPHQQLGQP
jgi:hypothetical protein